MSTRQDYLAYLSEYGYCEAEVLPMVPAGKESLVQFVSLMAGAMLKGHNEKSSAWFVEKAQSLPSENVNDLIAKLHQRLLDDFVKIGMNIPYHAFAGVFPQQSLNARFVSLRKDSALILIHNGCFDLLQAAVSTFLGNADNAAKPKLLADVISRFIRSDQPLLVSELNPHPFQAAEILNAAEKFIIAHEYVHLITNHDPPDLEKDVPENKHAEELIADTVAIDCIHRAAELNHPSDPLAPELALCGCFLFLGVNYLVNKARVTVGASLEDDHPDDALRIFFCRNFTKVRNMEKQMSYANSILALIEVAEIELIQNRS